MRLLLTILLVLAGVARPVTAQRIAEIQRIVGEREDNVLPADRYLSSVSFRVLFGGIIVGKACLNSFPDSLTFIFDTGCGSISLDSMTAARLGLVPRASGLLLRGVAGICPQRVLDCQTLRLGGVQVDSLKVQVADYDLLSSVYGEKIDGIVGAGFFSRYLVKIDYDRGQMDIYTRGNVRYPRGGFLLKPRLYGLPMLEGDLEDARAIRSRFYFDTGAGLCLLFSSNFTSDSAIFSPKRKKPVKIQGAGLGGKTEMQLTTLKTFSLGPFRFKKIPTYIFEDAYDVTSYPQLAGLIGNDLLRRFNLWLNYERSEIYILPNRSYKQPFDYSYSGVTIALIEGRIVVTDVIEESPAAKAGFREGDRVVAVNGDRKQDLQVYQGLLRTMGPKVKVLVQRENGKEELLLMKVRSIL
ncbi:MAG: aspartyl protease family protein [Bacteroidetes bacterium]|nr:aspartyl protease family protein [Bacteroidota bacterium]